MKIGLTRKFYPLADPRNFTVRHGNSPVSSAMMQVLEYSDRSCLDQAISRRSFHLAWEQRRNEIGGRSRQHFQLGT
jgi:hypothetical protein